MWLRAVSLFVNRSAIFVEAVFTFTFGFSYVLLVTVVKLCDISHFDENVLHPSSETQGQLVGSWGNRSGQVYKNERRTPGILLLTDQFRSQLKSLSVIGHKNIIRVQLFSCYFRDFLFEGVHRQTVWSPARHTCPLLAGEFPSIEYCHWKENHETEKISKFGIFVDQPEKESTEKIRLWTNRR